MSKKIKGITIQLEGDASPLEKALKDVDKASSKTSGELRKINGSLKFDQNNTVMLGQKFEVLQESIQHTTKRLDSLKQAQSEVDRMFKSGEIDGAAYREFQREIEITEGKLKAFRNQASDVKAKITVQADLKGLDKIKNELKSLPDDAKRAGKEIGQNLAAGAAAGAAGLGALTVGMTDTNKQLSRFESQAKSAMSSANKLGNNIKKLSDEEVEALEKATEDKEDALEKSYDKQLSMAEKSYDQKERAFDKSLDNEMDALKKAHDKKLKLIDTEYRERLKLIDEEEYKRLKAIDAQIEGIEAEQDAIDRANKLADENAKRTELQGKVDNAKTKKNRELAVKALAEYEAKIAEERQREERKSQVESLKSQKDAIKENADQQREAIQSELELKVSQVNEAFEAEKSKLTEIHDLKREQFAEQKSTYLASVKAQYDEELKLYKEMNAKKLEEAQKPVSVGAQQQLPSTKVNLDVSDFKKSRVMFDSVNQDVDQAVEAMGNLVRAGYETEEEITGISKNIAGAIQLYGDTFNAESLAESITTTTQLGEVTGQLTDLIEKNGMTVEDFNKEIQQYSTVGERAQYISELLAKQGMAEVYDEFARAHPEIIKASEAQVELTDALDDFTDAIRPLITSLTVLVTKIIELLAKNPFITKMIAILLVAISGLAAIFGALLSVVTNLMTILPVLSKFLPHLGKAFTVLGGPVGWIIGLVTTVASLAAIVVKNWEPIKGFFKDLWSGVVKTFESAIQGIKFVFSGVVNALKQPINAVIQLMNKFINSINKIKMPDWVPGLGGKGLSIPEIPMLAKGTDYFRGGMALVGERGPELVEMPTGAKVHPNNKTQDMLGGGVVITGNNFTVREEADIERISRQLYKLWQEDQRGR